MADAGSIWVRVGLNTDDLSKGIAQVKSDMTTWRDETNKGSTDVVKWGASLTAQAAPAIALGYVIKELTDKAAAFGKEIRDNARDLGLSTEEYQKWRHVAIGAGSSADEMTSSIRMMTLRLREASDPASEISRSLAALGVNALDSNGKMRSVNDVLLDVLGAINELPEGFDRNQASMDMFGRSFSNIADVAALSRQEIQALMDQAPVFSDDKIDRMDEYRTQLALVNEQFEIMMVDLGADLIPLSQDFLEIIQDLEPAIKAMAGGLHEAATGTHMMYQGLQLLYTQARYGMDSPEMKALQAEVQAYYEAEQRERSGYSDMSRYGAADALRRYGSGRSYSPAGAPGKTKDGFSAEEIRDKKLELRELTNITIPSLTEKLKDARLTGLKDDILNAEIALERATNKANDLRVKLGGAATEAATFNTVMSSSLNTGGVGPDWAGFSDLGNMSVEELQKVAEGGLGKSKGEADRAQTYLSMMKGRGASAGATTAAQAAKSPADTAKAQTQALQTEFSKQAEAYTTLADTIKATWASLEETAITHYTAMAEYARIQMQKLMDDWHTSAKYITDTVAYNQVITVTDGAMSASPIAFTGAAPPVLAQIDFSDVQGSGGKSTGSESSGGGNTVTNNVTVNVQTGANPNQIASAVRENLAGPDGIGGMN